METFKLPLRLLTPRLFLHFLKKFVLGMFRVHCSGLSTQLSALIQSTFDKQWGKLAELMVWLWKRENYKENKGREDNSLGH